LQVGLSALACSASELCQFKTKRCIRNAEGRRSKLRAFCRREIRHVLIKRLRLLSERIPRSVHGKSDHVPIEGNRLIEAIDGMREILQLYDRRRRRCLSSEEEWRSQSCKQQCAKYFGSHGRSIPAPTMKFTRRRGLNYLN